jgi:hypothetical protein
MASLSLAKLEHIDLFEVFVAQVNIRNKLVGEFFLCSLVVTIGKVHSVFLSETGCKSG